MISLPLSIWSVETLLLQLMIEINVNGIYPVDLVCFFLKHIALKFTLFLLNCPTHHHAIGDI